MTGKPKILIVDDEKNFREIFSTKLSASGFETVTAGDGKEAIITAKKEKPDLVLMDIHMPGESGTDVALAIKQNPETKNVKVAFLTNLKEPWPAVTGDHKNIAKELGMDDYLEKTDDLDSLVHKVQAIVSGQPTDAPPKGTAPTEAKEK